jgi:hypothetical protein
VKLPTEYGGKMKNTRTSPRHLIAFQPLDMTNPINIKNKFSYKKKQWRPPSKKKKRGKNLSPRNRNGYQITC